MGFLEPISQTLLLFWLFLFPQRPGQDSTVHVSDAIWYFSIPDFTNLVFFQWFGINFLADLFTVWYFKKSLYCLVFKILNFTK